VAAAATPAATSPDPASTRLRGRTTVRA
jgi:hypothetical protein